MEKPTLLEIVQEVLNDSSGDFVNSISDTEKSEQIANFVRSTYRAMLSNRNWPHTKRTINLTASGDNDLPTHMSLTDDVKELISIYYNKQPDPTGPVLYEEVKWKEPDDFLRLTFGRNGDNSNILTVDDPTGVKLLIQNDKGPSYYTSFDDNTMVFDSFDSDVDTTLQSSKTLARVYLIPDFELSDTFVPDLPDEAFTALIEEVKSRVAVSLDQTENIKNEQEARRQQRWLARRDWRVNGGIRYPDYGRKKGRRLDPTFRRD